MRIKPLTLIPPLLLISACTLKPVAVDPQQLSEMAGQDLQQLQNPNQIIDGAISLESAIARALTFNRDKQLKRLETALAHGQAGLARWEMLPQLTTSAGYSKRNNYAASASVTFENGQPGELDPNPSYSVSQDKEKATYGASFTWNILDFGLSYVRAKQKADAYLIARERERKVVHNITQEVRAAYWRTVSADRLLNKIAPVMNRTSQALLDARHVETQRLQPPLQALRYQRELLEVLRSLQGLKLELSSARPELAALMGLKPGTAFELEDVQNPDFTIPELSIEPLAMEELALTHRPELIENHYQKRISAADTRAAFLELLPGFDLNAGINHDNSKYLLNQDWNSIGANVSWNLMGLFRLKGELEQTKTREALVEAQRLATSMAVMTQVHLARTSFEENRENFGLASDYLNVVSRIYVQVNNNAFSQSSSELELIRESLNSLLAELRRDMAYAELQNSFGRVFVTMGLDLVPGGQPESLEALSQSIGERLSQWQQGELLLPVEAEAEDVDSETDADPESES